jgi:hypothetical protein
MQTEAGRSDASVLCDLRVTFTLRRRDRLQRKYLLTLLWPYGNTVGNRVSQQLLHGIFFHTVQLQVAVFLVSFQETLAFQVCGYP